MTTAAAPVQMANDLILPRAEVRPAQWDSLVDASDEAWLYHRGDLIDGLALWPGHADISFAVGSNGGELLVAVPLQLVTTRGRLGSRRRLFSLGGPALRAGLSQRQRDDAIRTISFALDRMMADHKAEETEAHISPLTPSLHGPNAPRVNPLVAMGFTNATKESWVVDLTKSIDQIHRDYSELTRRELRKAGARGLELREAEGPKDLEIYYRLHNETCARTGVEAHPFEYFQLIFERFRPRGLSRILFAVDRGRVVAAQNTATYKRRALYWTGASIDEKSGGENRLLFDNQITTARERGAILYETGEAYVSTTNRKEKGLNDFKRSFGSELYPFPMGRRLNEAPRHHFRRAARALAGLMAGLRPASARQ